MNSQSSCTCVVIDVKQKWKLAAAAKSLQSCPTLCDPIDGQPTRLCHPWDSPGKNTGVGCHSFSNAANWKVKVKSLSRVRLFATPWTAAYQAPPSMGFSRQEYWSGLPLPSPKEGLVPVIWNICIGFDTYIVLYTIYISYQLLCNKSSQI